MNSVMNATLEVLEVPANDNKFDICGNYDCYNNHISNDILGVVMEKKEKDALNELFEESSEGIAERNLLLIKVKPKLTVADDDSGMELNDGYEFAVDGALPEVADAIAKFAIELDKQGFGENAGQYFLSLVNQYFTNLNN